MTVRNNITTSACPSLMLSEDYSCRSSVAGPMDTSLLLACCECLLPCYLEINHYYYYYEENKQILYPTQTNTGEKKEGLLMNCTISIQGHTEDGSFVFVFDGSMNRK